MLLIYVKSCTLKKYQCIFIRDKKKPKEDIQAFKATAPGIAKFFLSQFSDVQFFITASFNAETMVRYVYVYIYAYVSMHVCMYVYIYACIYVYMCIYIHVCIYIYIYIYI
jgi:hypothetical protein